jgi:hypothetical protein
MSRKTGLQNSPGAVEAHGMQVTRRAIVSAFATIPARTLWSADQPKGKVIRVDPRKMTIQEALKESRTAAPGAPRTIILKGGRYLLDAPLALTALDSNLTIESAEGERAELNGGRRITGWRREGTGPLWVADLPENNLKPWRFRMLVVNGKIADRSRLPEKGFFQDENPDFNIDSQKATDEELTTLKYRPGDLGPSLDVKSAEVRVYGVWDESLSKIAQINDQGRTVRLITPSRFPSGAFKVHKYEILNVREGLRAPGQWFLDYGANKIYYWPRPGEGMATIEAWAPLTQILIRVDGAKGMPVKGLALSNLDLTITDVPAKTSAYAGAGYSGSINARYAEEAVFSGLRIRQVGASGILADGTARVVVQECEFSEAGACAIVAFSSNKWEVADCRIAYGGHSTPAAAGMDLNGDGNHIHHNEVHDLPYAGIVAIGNGTVAEFNNVFRVMLKMADGAAFHMRGEGGTLKNNWAREVGTGPESQAPAYYLDDRTTGYTVEHNAAVVMNWVLHVHNAKANTIRENVLASTGDGRVTFHQSIATIVERNVLFAAGKVGFEAAANAIASMRGNVLYSAPGKFELIRLDAKSERVPLDTTGNTIGDPRFVDVTHCDLHFQPGSPALQLGIPQSPAVTDVGPRKGPLKA